MKTLEEKLYSFLYEIFEVLMSLKGHAYLLVRPGATWGGKLL